MRLTGQGSPRIFLSTSFDSAGGKLSQINCHALAPTYAATDWVRIVELYGMLRAIAPSLVIDVNRALAIAMRSGARAGLDELDAIPEREVLGRYPYALAAYAELHASQGNLEEARRYLDRALEHQSSLLWRRAGWQNAESMPRLSVNLNKVALLRNSRRHSRGGAAS
jgi:predicted RNA polymerase sigma factor